MTTTPYWHEDPTSERIEPALPEPSRELPEPPALQITMSDHPEKPQTPPGQDRNSDSGSPGVEDMLQRISDKMDENDRRYGAALDDLHDRLESLSDEGSPAREAGDAETAETPERVEAQAAERVGEADVAHDPGHHQDTFEEIERRVIEFAEGTKADQHPADVPVHFDARFKDIACELEDTLSTTPPAGDLESPSAEAETLSNEFETVVETQTDGHGLQSIEATLANLTGYFERAEAQYGRMESIEGHLNQLIETMRVSTPDVAETARHAAHEAIRTFAEEGQLAHALTRLDAIEVNLRAINERSQQMDTRTVDALAAMNHTLTGLADQVGGTPSLQTDLHHSAIAPEQPEPQAPQPEPEPEAPQPSVAPPQPVEQPRHEPDTRSVAPQPDEEWAEDAAYAAPEPQPAHPTEKDLAEVMITHSEQATPQPTPDSSALGAELPDYQPMPSQPPDPQPHPVANEAMDPQPHPVDPRPFDKDDFLAAARRAAQAAAFQPEEPPASKGFLDRFKRKSRALPGELPLESKKPKSLMVFAALFLLVVSALLLYGRLMNKEAGSVTGFFERGTATPRAKSSSKLSTDPTPDAARTSSAPRRSTPEEQQPDRGLPLSSPDKGGRLTTAQDPLNRTETANAGAGIPESGLGVGSLMTMSPEATTRARFQRMPLATAPQSRQAAPAPTGPAKIGDAERRRIPLPPAAIGPASLRTAAAKGDAQAQFEVANRYAKGHGVKKDYAEAWRWYHRAAARSFAPAQYMLAALYERGLGTKRDFEQAKVWYRRAAGLGNVQAMHNLAVMYTGRDDKGADYIQAAEWFGKAASHGLADSQFNFGILHENGLGMPKSLTDAYKWFALAAKRGDEEAGKRRDLVKLQIDPNGLAAARRSVKAWQAAPVDKAANRQFKPEKSWTSAAHSDKAAAAPSPLVAKAQALLNKLGYEAGPADGKMGPKTTSAIRDFQMRSGLDATGSVSHELVAHLESLTG